MKRLQLVCGVLGGLSLYLVPATAAAVGPEAPETPVVIGSSELGGPPPDDTFVYRRVNRPDPFVPFVNEQTATAAMVEEEEEVLSGMQLFEPGQLDLVTILFSGGQAVAMVQDSSGRGHIIKPRQKIGRRGVVKDILSNVVVIEEWYLTTAGQKKYKNIEMVLRKEGDKS